MGEEAAQSGSASVPPLAPLLATLAQCADGAQGGQLWAGLRELLASRPGASPTGLVELDALRQAPDDPALATALATVIQERTAADPDFSKAASTWRAQDQIRILEQAAVLGRRPPPANSTAAGVAPEKGAAAPPGTSGPAAPPGAAATGDGTAKKEKSWARRGLATAATTAALALIAGLSTLFAGDLHNRLPLVGTAATHSAGPSSGPAKAEDFNAQANWCCKIISVEASTGFYWRGTSIGLVAALRSARGDGAALKQPAGLGLIEIPVQTSGTEPILVAPPRVIIRSRQRNLTTGMIAILPRAGQGTGSPGQFEADVDSAAPVTMPVGTTGRQSSSYQYVSAGSPAVLSLFVADANYDCTFDIQLTWQERGRRHTTVLSNGGKPFRIIGSAGLPWYSGNPEIYGGLTRIPAGRPFSPYGPR